MRKTQDLKKLLGSDRITMVTKNEEIHTGDAICTVECLRAHFKTVEKVGLLSKLQFFIQKVLRHTGTRF